MKKSEFKKIREQLYKLTGIIGTLVEMDTGGTGEYSNLYDSLSDSIDNLEQIGFDKDYLDFDTLNYK